MKKENIFNERDACTGAAGLPAQRVGTGPAKRPYESPEVTVVAFKSEIGFAISGVESRGFFDPSGSGLEGRGLFGSSSSGLEGRGLFGSSSSGLEGRGLFGSGGSGMEGRDWAGSGSGGFEGRTFGGDI